MILSNPFQWNLVHFQMSWFTKIQLKTSLFKCQATGWSLNISTALGVYACYWWYPCYVNIKLLRVMNKSRFTLVMKLISLCWYTCTIWVHVAIKVNLLKCYPPFISPLTVMIYLFNGLLPCCMKYPVMHNYKDSIIFYSVETEVDKSL